MDVQHVNVKFFVTAPEQVNLEAFLWVFSRWIQEGACEELLVDVADYRHVFGGPGIVLIGHQANYSMDNTGNRLGLLYNCKTVVNGGVQERFVKAARSALLACRRLEEDPFFQGKLKFSGQQTQLLINDRLLAPNTGDTYAALAPQLHAFFHRLYGGEEYVLKHGHDPRERFTVDATTAAGSDVAQLLTNLGN
ncbi:MAG TPA: hypothetical protein VGL91_10855 [Acidobacteriota bacterium]|jgi:hypothetical protein